MHSKIIQPGKQGRIAYDNKGSCARLVEYLGHEAKANRTSLSFFNGLKEGISEREAKTVIDSNVGGLRKGEVKFYSLVISPSQDELKWLGEENRIGKPTTQKQDPLPNEQYSKQASEQYSKKLQLFTREVMENYAANFTFSSGKKLSASDLVWYATIHYHREYKGVHQEVKGKEAKAGTLKPGPNAHVHIIVSKRERAQSLTLNPQGSKERFEITEWQKRNETSFDKLFSYSREPKGEAEKSTNYTIEQKERLHARISSKVSTINSMLPREDYLIQKKVEEIAQKKGYSDTFFYNLNRLERNLKKGDLPCDPLHLLEHNKDKKPERLEGLSLGEQIEKAFKVLSSDHTASNGDLSMPDIQSKFKKRSYRNAPELQVNKRSHLRTI